MVVWRKFFFVVWLSTVVASFFCFVLTFCTAFFNGGVAFVDVNSLGEGVWEFFLVVYSVFGFFVFYREILGALRLWRDAYG